MLNSDSLKQELSLPCGAKVRNRFLKSAMSEALGTTDLGPGPLLNRLYQTWSEGGTEILITGNVMIDARYLGEPGNVVVENEKDLEALKQWAKAGTSKGNHLWMQINHPGKQIPGFLCKEPVAPSAVPLKLPMFNKPRAMTQEEILETIQRYGRTAGIARKAGFTGVQIHGAHGYLVSQFLSPHHNQRTDEWGGSLENRMRFLREVYLAMREQVGTDFPVSLKVNSADFQRGGFTEEESLTVIQTIADDGIDLVEISGGNYEAPAMMNGARKTAESTRQREAYFLVFAEEVRKRTKVPIAVTGGFRTAKGMIDAVESGATDIIGTARPLAIDPDFPNRIMMGHDFQSLVQEKISTGVKLLDTALMLNLTWYERQLELLGKGKKPDPYMNPWMAAAQVLFSVNLKNLRRRRA
ncbi:MAG: NADH:flavin oxidoreductase/NADH oxidase family protein [SAR324 cluster bacterium]|nr:NADH:flavin oxidoreductase/NADH oxidase family protein [SAR324 cluster bacterium]